MTTDRNLLSRLVMGLALLGLLGGLAAWLAGANMAAGTAWAATTAIALVPLTVSVVRDLVGGRVGVDLIALLAMAGALALGEYAAGAVIALMLSGGQVLEDYASARARRELTALVGRAPRVVHRYEGAALTEPPLEEVRSGDLLLVRPGEVVPVDGVVVGDTAVLDESALTGEAHPVERSEGEGVLSGTTNAAQAPFRLRATATAEESAYAGIVRLVREAQAGKAPLVRLADRYAIWFLPVAVGVALLAWLLSGDPVRALAVLVVATPCPLILAAPVAIVAGISRAARRGVVVKGGGALEGLASGEVLVIDKTGTVTAGAPVLTDIEVFDDTATNELLRLAASLDLASAHVLAASLVRAARERGLALVQPTEVTEQLGSGIRGRVEGRQVALGKLAWVARDGLPADRVRRIARRTLLEGSASVYVALDGSPAGVLFLEDPVRGDAPLTLRALRRAGFARIYMVTGDHIDLAETVGTALGVDHVFADRLPGEKVEAVRLARTEGRTVMVGDGINDAPALAAADVGVAMGARGATASSEAADVVLVVDRLDRLIDARRIARRSRAIAVESILAGMGLSLAAMGFAAFGLLPPVAGALLQELIDVAVILNALRALRDERGAPAVLGAALDASHQAQAEHRELLPEIKGMRRLADRLDTLPPAAARSELVQAHRFLVDRILPHQESEDAHFYPAVAAIIGGEDPTAPMERAHQEIAHQIRVLGRLVSELPPEGPAPEDVVEIRRLLYSLNAILHLHLTQEEESYLALVAEQLEGPRGTKPAP